MDDHRPSARRGEGAGIGCDIVYGVGGDFRRVEHDVADECAVEEVFEAEVFIGVGRAGDGGAEVGVAVADMDVGGVLAVDLNGRWFDVAHHGRGVGGGR